MSLGEAVVLNWIHWGGGAFFPRVCLSACLASQTLHTAACLLDLKGDNSWVGGKRVFASLDNQKWSGRKIHFHTQANSRRIAQHARIQFRETERWGWDPSGRWVTTRVPGAAFPSEILCTLTKCYNLEKERNGYNIQELTVFVFPPTGANSSFGGGYNLARENGMGWCSSFLVLPTLSGPPPPPCIFRVPSVSQIPLINNLINLTTLKTLPIL